MEHSKLETDRVEGARDRGEVCGVLHQGLCDAWRKRGKPVVHVEDVADKVVGVVLDRLHEGCVSFANRPFLV